MKKIKTTKKKRKINKKKKKQKKKKRLYEDNTIYLNRLFWYKLFS